MAQFRAKRLDLGCFVNIKNIRDHTKRKVFEDNEPERYESPLFKPRARKPDFVFVPVWPILDADSSSVQQASPSVSHPEHITPTANESAGTTSTESDALLYPPDTDPE